MPLTVRSAALALALLTAPAGCQLFGHPGPTAVAQGRYFSTGNPDYDTFFVELHRLQVELKDAPDRVAEPRQALAKALDVGVDADVIKEALGKRASELGGKQVKLTVERPASSDKPVALKVTGSPSGDDAELVKTLASALEKIGELRGVIEGWKKSLDVLPQQASSLEGGVDTAFPGGAPGKRADIKHNLRDAQKMIGVLQSRTNEAEHANGELFDAVVAALGETAAPSSEKASEPEAEKPSSTASEKKARKTAPPPRPARAPKPAPPPRAAPKQEPKAEPKPAPKPVAPAPKPAAAEHTEAPSTPKPTQGKAKPDFEP